MMTEDFFHARLASMIDLRHPLVVLSTKLPWSGIKAGLAAKFARQDRPTKAAMVDELFGADAVEFGGGVSRAGRPWGSQLRLVRG